MNQSYMTQQTPTSPRAHVRPFTPADDASFASLFGVDVVNISIATAGDVHYIDADGVEATGAFPAGVFPGWFRKVFATDTDAAGFLAVW